MPTEPFDALARALARGELSRRGLLGALLGLALSAAMAYLRPTRAGAAGCPAGCTPESRCGRGSDASYCCAAPSQCQVSPDGNDAKCCPPEVSVACGSNALGAQQWEPICCTDAVHCCGAGGGKSTCCQPHEMCALGRCVP